ncbi:MAG: hypothetical protein NC078_01315 [Ruminococcus sp.]|nr:hypothetical protein [Ruminococcus sp.]
MGLGKSREPSRDKPQGRRRRNKPHKQTDIPGKADGRDTVSHVSPVSPARMTARCALMAAMLIGSKAALSGLPNFETVTLLIILFALRFGREVFWAIAVFNLCELVYWGGGAWWAAYLYIWNLVALGAILLRDFAGEDPLLWAAYSAVCGLFFGGLCSLVYIFIPDVNPWGYFLAGLPWDIAHGIYNFLLMLVLFKPLNRGLGRIDGR